MMEHFVRIEMRETMQLRILYKEFKLFALFWRMALLNL